jgi:hypothetical protein
MRGSLLRCICLLVANIVAKRFWVSEEATLIQDQPAIRKVDLKTCLLRFDCCAQAAPRRLLQQYRPIAEVSENVDYFSLLGFSGNSGAPESVITPLFGVMSVEACTFSRSPAVHLVTRK